MEPKTRIIPRVSAEDVGTYWTREDGTIWRLISFCEYPTVTWEIVGHESLGAVNHGARRGGAVGSAITEGFIRLVPERVGHNQETSES